MGGAAGGALLAGLVGAAGIGAAVLLSRRPGDEDIAIELAGKRQAAGDVAGALAALVSCAAARPQACRCADRAASVALDSGRYARASSVLSAARCGGSAPHEGLVAEALVATGQPAEGARRAESVLARDPKEPHAAFARAWAASLGGSSALAVGLADAAVKAGRGVPALLLAGTLHHGAGDLQGARVAFEQAARLAPREPRAHYDVGLVAQQQGRYGAAREAYLRALALDPRLADARYNLAVLTHAAGADDEARHHLEELAAIAPGDPRLASLRATLSGTRAPGIGR